MASAAQSAANRLNAQESTGPRTPRGKAAMRRSLDEEEPLADPAEESLRRLRALGRAYIRFALEDPGLFRTAFCRPDKPVPDAAGRMATHGPYALLSGVLDELVEHGVLDPDRRAGAEIPAWASVHGLATLLIDGPLALVTPEERARAVERSSDFMLNGIRGHRDRDPAADPAP